MELTILSSTKRLTKAFKADGSSSQYPLVDKFTSTLETYETAEQLFEILTTAASKGHCLLKGFLDKQIKNESRRGLNLPLKPTRLLVLDYDRFDGFDSQRAFLEYIDPALADCDYIFQESASSGIKGPQGLRGHYFFLLEKDVSPPAIKQWLTHVNLIEPFRSMTELDAGGVRLKYGLDISVNQNDKLIYLANPICQGFEDPVANRWTLVKSEDRTYTFHKTLCNTTIKGLYHKRVNELREANGFAKKSFKDKVVGSVSVIANPDAAYVSEAFGLEDPDNPFIRLNLNDGDSRAWWIDKSNIELVHCFKDDAIYETNKLIPDFYHQVLLKIKNKVSEYEPIVFRDMATDRYMNGYVNTETKEVVELSVASNKEKLSDFMIQNHRPAPRFVRDIRVLFDPTTLVQWNEDEGWLNRYRATKYIRNPQSHELNAMPPNVEILLRHLCVDQETYDYFVNWLAFIFQTREKTGTAWLFHGTYGTGKNVMFRKILAPLFGADYVRIINNEQINEKFNSFLTDAIFVTLDEGEADRKENDRIMGKLKSWITEEVVAVRAMRSNTAQERSWANFMVFSNELVPIVIKDGDRRWNVSPRQEVDLRTIHGDDTPFIDKIPEELDQLAYFLQNYKVNRTKARKPLFNKARENLMEACRRGPEEVFYRLQKGDLDFFIEFASTRDIKFEATQYREIIAGWEAQHRERKIVRITNDDLRLVYTYVTGNKTAPRNFGWLCKQNQMHGKSLRINDKVVRGFEVQFHDPELSIRADEPAANDVPSADIIPITQLKRKPL